MKINAYLLLLSFLFVGTSQLSLKAQSPRNLNGNIQPIHDFIGTITVAQIEANFNNARRGEETQLGLPANSIQNLDLPDQATWDGYSYDQKMLFLLNDERTARAGINYGDGACLGLPFEGVESAIDQIANDYAQHLLDNDIFEHNPNLASQMDNSPTIGGVGCMTMTSGTLPNCCHQEIDRDENLAGAGSGANDINAPVEDAVYGWNYVDGPSWGHREMNLLQNDNLPWSPPNLWGFIDDYGDNGKAGLIGVGVAKTVAPPYNSIVVLNYFDPAPACNFILIVDTDNLGGGNGSSCAITVITAGNQTNCDQNSNTYSQDLTITFNDAPASGNLVVNGQSFAIGTSPQMVTLTNLTADGQAVDVTAHFSVEPTCTFTQNNAFTAPAACNGGGGCNATTIACGQTISGDTNTGANNFSAYGAGCPDWDESGKELVYQITTTAMGDITATLSNINGGDLDIFILNGCNSDACVAGNDATATASNQPAGTYYIIVDGYAGDVGTFDLLVTANCGGGCNNFPPTNGNIPAGTYQVTGDITSSGTVNSPDVVIFKASNSIALGINFEVKIGATFEALIENCAALDEEVIETRTEEQEQVIQKLENLQIFPNPFSNQTTIAYQLDKPAEVSIQLFDINGRQVKSILKKKWHPEGRHELLFNADQYPEGIYTVLLNTPNQLISKRIVLMR